jgi:hypothetical protein
MGSFTTWIRVEPRTRTESLPGLAARVADPLWMLARQWQSAEFIGSDGGTPVMARLTYDSAPLTRWTRGAGQSGDVGEVLPEGVPLEALVDLVPAPIGLRERAAGGQHFLRLLGAVLAERYGGGYLEHFGLAGLTPAELESCDDRDVRWSDLLAGRSIDGLTLRVAFADPTTPTIPVLHRWRADR